MKIVAVNGSPRREGNTYHALRCACDELERCGIQTEILHVGGKAIRGCIACGGCAKTGRCVLADEEFLGWCDTICQADGLILGSPVYYADIAGTMKCFLDRLFYSRGRQLRHKVGAAVAVVRRSGGMTTFDQLNNYFLISEMLVAPSFYWNVAHGRMPGEVLQDGEGLSTLQNMARTMAWLLRMKEATRDTIPEPEPAERQWTHFIR